MVATGTSEVHCYVPGNEPGDPQQDQEEGESLGNSLRRGERVPDNYYIYYTMIDLPAIKAKLEAQTCAEHNQHPAVSVLPEGVSIAACCQPFHSQMNTMLESEIDLSIKKAIDAAMQGL